MGSSFIAARIARIRNSMSLKVVVILVSVIILLTTTFGVLNYRTEKNRAETTLLLNARQTSDRMSNSLIYPIWIVDDDEIRKNIILEMADLNIQTVALLDAHGKLYIGLTRDAKWSVVEYREEDKKHAARLAAFLTERRSIVRNGVLLGTLEIEITDRLLRQILEEIIWRTIIQIIILSMVIIGVLFFIMRKVIFQPIGTLERSVAGFSHGDFSIRASVASNDEIGRLAATFNSMALELENSFRQIKTQLAEIKTYSSAREKLLAQLETNNLQLKKEIDERVHAEALLRESEEKHRNLIESAPDGIIIATTDGEVVSYNQAFTQIFKMSASRLTETFNLKTLYLHPQDDHRTILAALHKSGHLDSHELECQDFQQRIFTASLSARLTQYEGRLCIQAIIRDISKIKLLENDLRNYADNLEKMVEAKTTALRSANDELSAAITTLEQTREQLIVSAHQAGMAEVAVSILHNIGNAVNSINVRTCHLAELISMPELRTLDRVFDLMGGEGVIPSATDQERERKASLLRLCGAIREALKEKTDILRDGLAFILKALNHIMEIIAIQQQYAGVRGQETQVDPRRLIEDALEILADSLARRQIVLSKEFAPLPEVYLDKNRMVQILINIIKNAYEAIDENQSQTEKRMEIRASGPEHLAGRTYIKLEVKDNGAGFPAERKNSLFQFGFSTKQRGSGFGLHAAANYLKAHGGQMDIQSPGPGLGAVVTLHIPTEPVTRH